MFYCPQCNYPSPHKGACPHHGLPLVIESELPVSAPEDDYVPPVVPVAKSTVYGVPLVISDEIHGASQMDFAAGQRFTSKTDRKAYYKKYDMERVTVKEAQDIGVTKDHPKIGKTHIIPGVKKRQGLKWHERAK